MKENKKTGNRKRRRKKRASVLRPVIILILTVAAAAVILWALTWLQRDAAGPPWEAVPGIGQLYGLFHPDASGDGAGSSEAETFREPWEELPVYRGIPFVRISGDRPFFSEEEIEEVSGSDTVLSGNGTALSESGTAFSGGEPVFQPLDERGRCGPAMMVVSAETMPAEEREPISDIQPSGWTQAEYDSIHGEYLFNRCHLIGYQLCGVSADERNLITGTRYLNITGMQPWEDWVAEYVCRTGHHVLYRVTPVFEGQNLVAAGVLLEALGVEDPTFHFCVYCFNVQPGIQIDYRTGKSAEETAAESNAEEANHSALSEITPVYILNTNSGKFHRPECAAAQEIAWRNRIEWIRSREEICELGYTPCGFCDP